MKEMLKKLIGRKSTTRHKLHPSILEAIIDKSEAFVITWRVEPAVWPVEHVSKNVEDILGYPVDDFISGRVSWVSITHQDDLPRLEREISQHLDKGIRNWSQKYRLITKSGEVRWFRDDNLAVTDAAGRITRIMAVVHDITQYHDIESALQESEEWHRALVETSGRAGLGIAIVQNIEGREAAIVFVNDVTCAMSGYSREQLLNMSVPDLIPLDIIGQIMLNYKMRQQDGSVPHSYEAAFARKDGTTIPLIVSVALMQLHGKPATVAFFRDITVRKRMEEALRESEYKYSSLVENASDGVNIIQDKLIKFANKRMAEISGYTVKELTGMPTFDLIPPDFAPVLKERFAKREQGQDIPEVFYSQMLCKDGSVKEIENSTRVIQYDGRPAVLGITRDITERKRMEEKLHRQEKYFHALIEHSSDIIVTVDRNGVVIYQNPAIQQVLGFTPEERAGRNVFDLVHPDDLQRVLDAFNVVKSDISAPIQRAEIRIKHKVESWRDFEVTVSNLVYDSSIESVIINMRDITERKRIEREISKYRDHLEELIAERTKALQESEEKFRIIFDSIADGISVIDLATGKLVNSNPAALQMFNFTREDVIGTYSFDLIAEKDRQRALEDMVQTLKNGYSDVQEWCLLGKDGKEYDCEARAAVIYDQSGKPLYLVNVMRDIGERKQAVEAIKESERRYRILAENVSDVILTLNMDLRFTYLSASSLRVPAFKRVTTISSKDLINISVMDVLTPESFKEASSILAEEIAVENAGGADLYRSRHMILQSQDELNSWLDVKASFIRDHNRKATGILCIVRDITQLRKDLKIREELELKAQINSRLASIGEMAAGIAHEINNPLSPIIGFSELLLKEDLQEGVKADLRIINTCARQAADVTKRLLVFARQTKPVRSLCNINDVITNTIQITDYHLKTSNINVYSELEPALPETMADAAQMQQVLLNLLMNAEYAMIKHHGKGNIMLKTEHTSSLIRILVKDDGPGISKENIDKVFEPFFTTKKAGEGTGLGLSICHGIIAEHKGRIWVDSEENKGAAFIIELPIIKQDQTEGVNARPLKISFLDEKTPAKSGANILVVDDESSTREYLRRVLTSEGYEVTITGKAKEALQLLIDDKGRFDIILLDIKLPDMSGIDMYQHLNQKDTTLTKKIIFMTGDAIGKDTADFISKAKADCITKPFSVEQLLREINVKLAKRE